jgi:hypothetical protein
MDLRSVGLDADCIGNLRQGECRAAGTGGITAGGPAGPGSAHGSKRAATDADHRYAHLIAIQAGSALGRPMTR